MVSPSFTGSPRLPKPVRNLKSRHIRKAFALILIFCAIGFAVLDFYRPDYGSINVLTAARPLAPGAVIKEADYVVTQIPSELAPASALSDTALVEGKTLAGPMSKGEVFVPTRFISSELADALTGSEHSKIVAVKPAESGIVSVLQVGDVVDVVAAQDGTHTAAPIAAGARVAATGAEDTVFLALSPGAAEIVAAINITTPITLVLSR